MEIRIDIEEVLKPQSEGLMQNGEGVVIQEEEVNQDEGVHKK